MRIQSEAGSRARLVRFACGSPSVEKGDGGRLARISILTSWGNNSDQGADWDWESDKQLKGQASFVYLTEC